jgi:hypothetical protein
MSTRRQHGELDGEMLPGDTPNWEPLLDAVGSEVTDGFMWMFAVRCSDGRRLDAYKHWVTRGYLHLDALGDAFVYTGAGRYRRTEFWRQLEAVLSPWWEKDLWGWGPEALAAAVAAVHEAKCSAGDQGRRRWLDEC